MVVKEIAMTNAFIVVGRPLGQDAADVDNMPCQSWILSRGC